MHKAGAFPCFGAGLMCLALLLPHPATAAWPTDPLVNVPLCTVTGNQYSPTITSDGAGGAIVTWSDYRGGATSDIYAQRISADGTALWAANGVALCTATGDQSTPIIASDSAGGAIVTWQDMRNGNTDIYAQRISAGGAVQWLANGVALCTAASEQYWSAIVPDSAGGAIITWSDARNGTNFHLYAQRISAGGTVQWMADGVDLSTATGNQYYPTLVPDGAGGAIVAWGDDRSSGYFNIYAQRISAAGEIQWAANGVALCTATLDQKYPTIVPDSAGGAIVAWCDGRSGNNDIYAQRISAAGVVQWTLNGLPLCTATGNQQIPTSVSDGAGGAIVTWYDGRNGAYDIYVQRISAAGAVHWTSNGVALCTATGSQGGPTIHSDGAGGAIVTWHDPRSGGYDIYAQRIPAGGTVQWTADGVALCTATGDQYSPTIVLDGAGGAIVTWNDYRNGATSDIYAQRVQADGQLGGTVGVPGDDARGTALALEPVRPNPSRGGALTVRFTLASGTAASLELLDIAGRRIAAREVGSLGAGRHALDLGEGRRLSPGLYLVCLRQGSHTRVTRVAVLK